MTLMRISPVVAYVAGVGLCAAADPSPGWHFVPGDAHVYQYEVRQETVFESAGDKLTYTTSLGWRLAMARSQTPAVRDRVTLGVTILRITAQLDGPASHHSIDTDQPSTAAAHDPLFGHLFDLNFAGFTLVVDPLTGVVDSVSGGDAVAAKIASSEPSAFSSDDPSPLSVAAHSAYSSAALSALYSQLLLVPGSGQQSVPLEAPLSGSLVRTWNHGQYTLALPQGVIQVTVALGSGPLAVTGALSGVAGGGSVSPKNGIPGSAEGRLAFVLTLTALTQPVVEHQTLTWHMSEIQLHPK